MPKKKIYYVKSVRTSRGHTTIWEGTLDYLINNVFGYTLECGNSWNNKIPREPKTIKGLVSALNRSADETRRYYDYYEISSKEEFDASDKKEPMREE